MIFTAGDIHCCLLSLNDLKGADVAAKRVIAIGLAAQLDQCRRSVLVGTNREQYADRRENYVKRRFKYVLCT